MARGRAGRVEAASALGPARARARPRPRRARSRRAPWSSSSTIAWSGVPAASSLRTRSRSCDAAAELLGSPAGRRAAGLSVTKPVGEVLEPLDVERVAGRRALARGAVHEARERARCARRAVRQRAARRTAAVEDRVVLAGEADALERRERARDVEEYGGTPKSVPACPISWSSSPSTEPTSTLAAPPPMPHGTRSRSRDDARAADRGLLALGHEAELDEVLRHGRVVLGHQARDVLDERSWRPSARSPAPPQSRMHSGRRAAQQVARRGRRAAGPPLSIIVRYVLTATPQSRAMSSRRSGRAARRRPSR